jgi:metal-responsive CopG/Arc/MetJ family transcriptional regulator
MLSTKRLSLRIPEQVFQELEQRSQKTGNPVSSIIRQALNEYLYGKDVRE